MSTTSVRDIKIFIEALSLIGGDDFVPTQEQWSKIKDKIMSLEDPATVPRPVQHNNGPHAAFPVAAVPEPPIYPEGATAWAGLQSGIIPPTTITESPPPPRRPPPPAPGKPFRKGPGDDVDRDTFL